MELNPYDPVMLDKVYYEKVKAFRRAEGQPSVWQRLLQRLGFH